MMVIVGILATGVVFMFADPTAKVKAAAFELRGDLNLARAEAVRRNQNILVDFVFNACNKEDFSSGVCGGVCSKVDKTSFDACYDTDGSNQGYVICIDEDANNSCEGEVSVATPAEDIEEKIIKTVLFRNSIRYYEFGTSLPSAPSGPHGAPPIPPAAAVSLANNNGITFGELPIPGNNFVFMNPNGTSGDEGSVIVYLPAKDSDLKVKGKPYAVVVDSESTGRVRLERWRPDLGASGEWSRK